MNFIKNNPYRVLGVFSDSSMKEIVSNFGKIKAFAKTGKTISFDNDFVNLFGPIQRSTETATKAYNSISLPKDRIVAGLFWFLQNTKFDELALNHLRGGNIQEAIDLLRKKSTASACINLAILHLIDKNWATALYYYTYLLNSEEKRNELLSVISSNSEILSEKEVVDAFTEKLISSYPNVAWVEIMNQQEVLINDKSYNIKDFFGQSNVYESIVKKSNEKLLKLINTSLSKAESVTKNDAQANLEVANQLEKNSKLVLRSLRYSLGKESKEYKKLCDNIATQILDNCIEYYNHDKDNSKRARNILQLLRFAMRTAEGKIAKERCQKNFNQIKQECDSQIPDEIEGELSYIRKQIDEFKKLSSNTNNPGYLNATLGICYQKMESIKRKIGADNKHYIQISSQIVNFAVDVILKEVSTKYFSCLNSKTKENLNSLKDAVNWGNPIIKSLKPFAKDSECEEKYKKSLTALDIYSNYDNIDIPDDTSSYNSYKLETSCPTTTTVGKVFSIHYNINYRGNERFIAPVFRELSVVRGPIKRYNLKVTNVGTKSISEPTTTYSYELMANRAGTFTITPASIIINGEVFKSRHLTIKVNDNVASPYTGSRIYEKSDPNISSKTTRNSSGSDDTPWACILGASLILIFVVGFLAFINGNGTGENRDWNESDYTIFEDTVEVVDTVAPDFPDEDDFTYDEDIKEKVEEEKEEESAPTYEVVYHNTGDRPYQSFYGRGSYDGDTQNSLLIKNGSTTDAVVFLETFGGRKIRHVYICANESFTMTQIPGGKYIIKIIQGNSWNPEKYNGEGAPKGGFMENLSMTKSETYDPFDYPYPDSGHYYNYEVTLYKVANGNMQTENISSSEMF